MKNKIISFFMIFTIFYSGSAYSDYIELKSGHGIECVIVKEDNEKVTVLSRIGKNDFRKVSLGKIVKHSEDKNIEIMRKYALSEADGFIKAISPEEYNYLKKGYIKYEGQWLTKTKKEEIILKRKKEEFEKAQKAKGLVKYKNEWMTPEKKYELEQIEKGSIKYQDKWITESEYKKILIQENEQRNAILSTEKDEDFYEIIERSDISMKALTKNLSQYSSAELSILPMNKRIRYKVLVSPDLEKHEYEKLINRIIQDFTKKDNDIDEIALWIYDDKSTLNFGYNVARVLWHPSGGWGFTVTPRIASRNDRSGYKTTIEWTDKYVFKFKEKDNIGTIKSGQKKTIRNKARSYEYSISYPEEVKVNETNEIELKIANLSSRSDSELVVSNVRYVKEKGEFISYTKEALSPFKIVGIKPDPNSMDFFFGIKQLMYKGIQARKTEKIIIYFKLSKEGMYRSIFSFYTDKYADDEKEDFPEIDIKCTK